MEGSEKKVPWRWEGLREERMSCFCDLNQPYTIIGTKYWGHHIRSLVALGDSQPWDSHNAVVGAGPSLSSHLPQLIGVSFTIII